LSWEIPLRIVLSLGRTTPSDRRDRMTACIGRRAFITLLGGAAVVWPLVARAQQRAMPVIGYLNKGSPESDVPRLTGLRRGLNQTGYIEGRNLVIEYRWAGNQADQLPALATDLVQLRVAVIVSPAQCPFPGTSYFAPNICSSKPFGGPKASFGTMRRIVCGPFGILR
jgi:hypothetical protein